MKVNYFKRILVPFAVAMCMSCNVDSSYDISEVDDSSLGIGTDNSEITMTVATVQVDVESLFADTDTSASASMEPFIITRGDDYSSLSSTEIVDLINSVSVFLPSVLEGDYADGIDIDRLESNEDDYTTNLVENLFTELENDSEKRLAFCEYLLEDEDSYESLLEYISDDTSDMTADDLSAELFDLMGDSDNAAEIASLKSEVFDVITDYAEQVETDYSIEESLDGIDIDESVYDIVGGNLDGDKNYLRLLTSVETNLPFEITLTTNVQYGENWCLIPYYSDRDTNTADGYIDSVDMLQEILSDLKLSVDIALSNFLITSDGFSLDGTYLYIKIIIIKGGSISF